MLKKVCAVVVAGCVVAAVAVSFIDAQPKSAGLMKVGVVNLVDVMNNFDRTKDLNTDFQARQGKVNAQYQERLAELKAVEKKRDHFNAGSDEYEKLRTEITTKAFNLRAWRELQFALLEDEHRRLTTQIYLEITKAAAKFAKTHGYSLLLRLDEIDIKSESSRELMEKIRAKTIIYSDASVDVTAPLLKSLNTAYHARAGKGE